MNATFSNLQPLPAALHPQHAPPSSRRRLVGGYSLDHNGLDRFNHILDQLHHAPLNCDQLASAARQLMQQPIIDRQPACIEQRLRCATTIGLMLADPGWQPANDAFIAPAHLVVDYVDSDRDLIPDSLPQIGRLDDAIVIDAAWSQLAAEVSRYREYVHEIEREARVSAELACELDHPKQACRAGSLEVNLRRAFRARSYLPSPAAYFRVY